MAIKREITSLITIITKEENRFERLLDKKENNEFANYKTNEEVLKQNESQGVFNLDQAYLLRIKHFRIDVYKENFPRKENIFVRF